MAMTRMSLICAVLVLTGIPAGAQSSAAISAARGVAASAGAPAREIGTAQQSTPAPVAPGTKAPSSAAEGTTEQTPETTGFTYNREKRRDPFVSLVGRGANTGAGGSGLRPAGLAGLASNEVTLRGTLRSRDGFVAMLQGSDQKTYIVRPGDKLFDGTVSSITQNDLVILQQVEDPLSTNKQREVRKGLRQAEAN